MSAHPGACCDVGRDADATEDHNAFTRRCAGLLLRAKLKKQDRDCASVLRSFAEISSNPLFGKSGIYATLPLCRLCPESSADVAPRGSPRFFYATQTVLFAFLWESDLKECYFEH